MIGFIDSGIGGIYVLKKCLQTCPNNHYVYLADNKNIPFGNKTRFSLRKIAKTDCEILIKKGCDIIVFACNTLTAAAIDFCRKKFKNIVFVGIEPAVVPAMKSGGKNLVLLTNATYKFSKLVKKYKYSENLIFAPQKYLAIDIENGNLKSLNEYFSKQKVSGVVLGCTHYNFIRNDIKSFLLNKNFFEASEGVSKRLAVFAKNNEQQKISFLFTGKDEKERYLNSLLFID